MRSKGSQKMERRVRVLPREVLTQLRQLKSEHHRWMLDEKEAQQGRLATAGRAFFVFFEML